ncbi:uncharacterized protein LOC112506867 [Cynara cardunculus var. scolymus]|uniref:C2 calcium-dependent membrane targeting n=1 Tax=Cynara cardunculus var. scolymus TaxID=59895 RepID=A0A124SI08_CYNCS|nr:uncharacterized protein LOC112506867 [Cynara cardunculus var. scolymus]KVI11221.1 C2 calcium-dependent membrane targeting [Cynara cardunculus var. scolymus]
MDSYDQTTRFRYNPTQGSSEFSGILEIYVHHARNIHNICIYENQDVYAKFSLTYNPDETFSTKIINGGGKNPEFNEKLVIKITQFDAVLKCEMWMLSRAKNYMEDQLLGFSLVPISLVVGKGELTQDFSLSSTDLFHSPAGTVKLSLSFNTNLPFNPSPNSARNSSITSEVVLLDRKISEVALDPIEYSRIEFPDINVVRQNQQMVSEYFGHGSASKPAMVGTGSFLCLGACDHDYEMVANSGSISPEDSIQNSGFFSSTMTSLGDDRNSADSLDKKNTLAAESSNISPSNLDTKENTLREKKELKEESAMQQQIVDMYMRSMQQFTESLAKMKLPMNLEKIEAEDHGDVIQRPENNVEIENKKKDGGARVFYGSRAFF